MARIPDNNFGLAVAAPAQTPGIPDLAGPQRQASRAIDGAISNVIQQENADAEHVRQVAAHAAALGATNDAQDAIAQRTNELQDDIIAGRLHGDEAPNLLKTFVDKTASDIPQLHPDYDATVREQIRGQGNSAQRAIQQAATKRGRMDVTGAIQREYDRTLSMFGANPDKARAAWAATHELVSASDLTPEQVANIDDAWNKGAANAEFLGHVAKAGDNLGALHALAAKVNDPNAFQGAASDQRERWAIGLAGTIDRIEAKQERAAERAAREEELRITRAGAAFNAFQALADKGTALDPAYTSQVLASTAGTPYQSAVRAQIAVAKETGGLAAQPIIVQQHLLDQIDRQIAVQGRSPALDARREQIAKVLAGSRDDRKNDALRAAFERGVVADLAPVDVSNFQSLKQTAGARAQQTALASQWAGRQVSPLTADEAGKVAERAAALQPRDRAAYLGAFADAFGESAMMALSAQIASNPNDRSLAIGASLARHTTTGNRSTAEVYFLGQTALAQGTVKPDAAKETGTRAAIFKSLEGVYRTETETRLAADAAYNIWAGLKAGGRDNVTQAVSLATGGIIEHNGVPIVKPYGMSDDAFAARVGNVQASDIHAPEGLLVGGQRITADQLARRMPSAVLRTWGDGTYTVQAGGAIVIDASTRQPFIFDPRKVPATERPRPVAPTPAPSPEPAPTVEPNRPSAMVNWGGTP